MDTYTTIAIYGGIAFLVGAACRPKKKPPIIVDRRGASSDADYEREEAPYVPPAPRRYVQHVNEPAHTLPRPTARVIESKPTVPALQPTRRALPK